MAVDFSKLKIQDGLIHYSIYQQDGTLQPMTVRDTYEMRLFVSWVQAHDRYTPGEAPEIPDWSVRP